MKIHKPAILLALLATLPAPAFAGPLTNMFSDIDYLAEGDMLQGMLAKELCSCVYVSGLSLDDCKAHMPLPAAVFAFVTIDGSKRYQIVATPTVGTALVGANTSKWAEATFDPKHARNGCRLVVGALTMPKGTN